MSMPLRKLSAVSLGAGPAGAGPAGAGLSDGARGADGQKREGASPSISHIRDEISALAKKSALAFDFHGFTGEESEALFRNGKLKTCSSSDVKNLNLRVLKDGKAGVSRTKDFSKEGLRECFEKAEAALRLTDRKEGGCLASGQNYRSFPAAKPQSEKGLSGEQGLKGKIEKAEKMDSIISQCDKRLKPVYSGVSGALMFYFFGNSEGAESCFRSQEDSAASAALAKDGAYRSEGFSMSWARRGGDLPRLSQAECENTAREAANKALKKLRYAIPKTKKYPVVFKAGEAAGDLIREMAKLLSGKLIFDKLSPFQGAALGQSLFSKNFSLYDDPFAGFGVYGRPFDGEGFASERTCLIEDGVLQNYLTSSFYARALKAPHTKKAVWGDDGSLGASLSHIEMAAGRESFSFEALAGEYPETVVIDRLKGWAGFNPISGDFSIESEGFLWKGKEAAPLCQFTVSGNILKVFSNILKVGNDSEAYEGMSRAPSFLVPELTISGK